MSPVPVSARNCSKPYVKWDAGTAPERAEIGGRGLLRDQFVAVAEAGEPVRRVHVEVGAREAFGEAANCAAHGAAAEWSGVL